MGGIEPKLSHKHLENVKKPYCFILLVPPHYIKKKDKKDFYILSAEKQSDLVECCEIIKQGIFTRKVSTMLTTLPCLQNRQYLSQEGIFRVAGDRHIVEEWEKGLMKGEFPDFVNILKNKKDLNMVHCVSDVFKRSLRFMKEPLVPFAHYKNFINLVN
eukprot:UN28671